jgi:ribose-phosphate pyrophosphokinase
MNIIGHVQEKKCILIDDMIDTAGTITLAADALQQAGSKEIYASCTHPVLSGLALDRIEKSAITKMVVTDSIYLPSYKRIAKIEEISVGGLIGEALVRIHENRTVSVLFENHS